MVTVFVVLVIALWKFLTYPFEPLARFICRKEKDEEKRDKKEFVCLLIWLIIWYAILKSPDMVSTYVMKHHESSEFWFGFYKNYNLVVHLLMLAYGFRWFWGAIRVLKGNPDALTDEESQRLYKASRINAEKDEAYWNGYWDGFIGWCHKRSGKPAILDMKGFTLRLASNHLSHYPCWG